MTEQLDNVAVDWPGATCEPAHDPILEAECDTRASRDYRKMLRQVALRATRQRVMLGRLLFSKGNRHVRAEMLYEEALEAKMPVSLATVYNVLNQFTEAGLLRQIGVDGSTSFFDTNPSEHHHFFIESENALIDISPAMVSLDELPEAPKGYDITGVAVVIRLRRKQA